MKSLHLPIPDKILPDASSALIHDEPTALKVFDQMAALLSPGEYYFFIVELPGLKLRYASDSFYERLNFEQPINVREVLKRFSKKELERLKAKERLVKHFYQDRLTADEALFYKTVYTVEMDKGNGETKKFLHQSIPLELDDNKQVSSALVVQVDVDHLMVLSTHYVSFIGTEGRPSFTYLDPANPSFEDPERKFFTKREVEIIALISQGLSKEEVADELNIAPSTVHTHRKNALKKSDAQNINELVANWVRKGWV